MIQGRRKGDRAGRRNRVLPDRAGLAKRARPLILSGLSLLSLGLAGAQVAPPAPCGPVPSENQLRWQEMEFYAFLHFSLNTYTDQSWGFGNEDVRLFNPTELDAREWVRVCKAAGMKGIILTAKHHSGFCLWPSKHTEYSVKNSPWKGGKGDVVKELAQACKEQGLKLGIYLSPWDRNHADYGRPEYITYFRNQLTELLASYGPIFEVWFDGANGGSGWYGGANETRKIDAKTYYDWPNTYALVRKLQPKIVIWNDGGDRADLRWVGTEAGYVGETNWSLLNAKGEVTWSMLHHGLEEGDAWVPAEVNTSIRPEWFYHPSEDDKVKSVPTLLDAYYASVGRNAAFLLNFPIMPNGKIHPTDIKNALEMGKVVRQTFSRSLARGARASATNTRGGSSRFGAQNALDGKPETYWAADDGVTQASITLELKKPESFNRFLVQEHIRLGQRVKGFVVEAWVEGKWKEIGQGTTIGAKRILRFPTVTSSRVRFTITDSKAAPTLASLGIYNAPLLLESPRIMRNQKGEITISSRDVGPIYHYTLDGSTPTPQSPQLAGPLATGDGKVEVKAIAFDPATGASSPVAHEKFDVSRRDWKVVGTSDGQASALFDGDPLTSWKQPVGQGFPVDLVIDLGRTLNLTGFRYHPDTGAWGAGLIAEYEFHVSADGASWQLLDRGEFANIKNSRIWHTRPFSPTPARFIKLRALRTVDGSSEVGWAEVDVITD